MAVIDKQLTGAPKTGIKWKSIDWKTTQKHVYRLQMRIAKATREGKHGKVKSLQWILTHSFHAKLLAIKRVTQNKGAKTPGVDGIIWKTDRQKVNAVKSLKRHGYKTKPLKRIYIPKKQKRKKRPLSIPTMLCRAQQALHLLALEPVMETIVDKNFYGFRPLRSTADAIGQCFINLSRRHSAQYILEADIQSCFDLISHQWLLENVTMDKVILEKWLNAGYLEKGEIHKTKCGTPQGGLISPVLLNVTLTGLEEAVKTATDKSDKVNVVAYADDFIITGRTKEILENKVKPAVKTFLSNRGLTLSEEKTKIAHINEGFNFLGINIRKYNGKLLMKPAKDNVKLFLSGIREIIKKHATIKTENLIALLNPKIRGWTNYYRHVCSKRTFNYVDNIIFHSIWKWAKRRHPNKKAIWIKNKYFRTDSNRNWIFFSKCKSTKSNHLYAELIEAIKTPIKRHVKIKSESRLYNQTFHEYLLKRKSLKDSRLACNFHCTGLKSL